MPADARRAAATPMPSPCHILAQGPAGCQLGYDHTVLDHNLWGRVNLKRQGTLDRVTDSDNVPHMGVNSPHENPGTDRSLPALLVNESINVPRLLCVCDQCLDVRCITVPSNKLGSGGTLGTDQATEDDHCFFSFAAG